MATDNPENERALMMEWLRGARPDAADEIERLCGPQITKLTDDRCPCCRQPVPRDDLVWTPIARALVGRGSAIQFGPIAARIFDILWRARRTGELFTNTGMMERVYANDPNGGPDTRQAISVNLANLRRDLIRFNLAIDNGGGRNGGYRLIPIGGDHGRDV